MIKIRISKQLVEECLTTGAKISAATVVRGIPSGSRLRGAFTMGRAPDIALLFDDGQRGDAVEQNIVLSTAGADILRDPAGDQWSRRGEAVAHQPRLVVHNLHWKDQTVFLDGYSFVNCRFDNCELVFASAEYSLTDCEIIECALRPIAESSHDDAGAPA